MSEYLSTELGQHLKQIIESLKANRCAVLVGAGFSRNADSGSLFAPTFPTWNELADTFYEKLHSNMPKETQYLNPLVLAEQVEAAYGRPVLNQLLISRIPDTQYSPSVLHTKLLSLPWRDIFTTNYDTLLERACKDITSKRFNIINCKEDLVSSSDAPRIIKLHGTFPSHRPFIITAEDYRRYPQEFAPFINTVQQSLLENTLCLIGFSGDDPNFNQWIGWIHDNLGLENSPQIYLFSHEDYSHAQKKLLDRKKVVVLNISSFASKSNPRQKYERLLDHLLDSVRTAQVLWPEPYSLHYAEQPPLSSVLSALQKIRKAYPGWLILPYNIRKRALFLRSEVEDMLRSTINEPHKEELSLLYEYDWLREKCLRPPFQWELRIYSMILERYLCNSDEDHQMRLSIQLSLLRDLRESGDFKAWNELFKKIESQLSIMNDEQLNRFIYEHCLFFMFNFNYKELQSHLQAWNVNEQSPRWVLLKSGLLAECNELLQAQELLQNSLILVRRQIQSDDQNLLLLSHESALMSLKNYIEQSISMEKDYGQSWRKQEDTEFERRQAHKKFTTDWHAEDERFQLLLNTSRQAIDSQGEQFSFDFGRRKFSFTTNEDTDLLNAYAFLRFREETGHPFRIQNITSGNKTAIRAVERITPYSVTWAIVTIARSNETKSAENILSRAILSSMTALKADELCKKYLSALRYTIVDLDTTEQYNSFAGFSTEVLPQLLSQFCCKCTLAVLDDMLQILLEIYQSNRRLNYKKVDIWIERLVRAFTREQLSERISVFVKFPFFSEEAPIYRELPDPLNFLKIPFEKPTPVTEVVSGTENLFIHARFPSELQLSSLRRLAILSCNGWLTQEQDELLGSLLWKDNLILQTSFGRSISLISPHPSNVNPKEFIRASLLSDPQKFTSEVSDNTSDYVFGLNEIPDEIFPEAFTEEDIPVLLPTFEDAQRNLIRQLGKNTLFDANSDQIIKKKILQLIKKLTRLLLISSNWKPSSLEHEIVERILHELRGNQLTHLSLELLWAKKSDIPVDTNNIINAHLLLGSSHQKLSSYDTLIIMIDNKEQKFMVQKEIKYLIAMIAQQILWRSDSEHLITAINVMCKAIQLAPEAISYEIEYSLLTGLHCLQEESEFIETDAVFMAVPKGELRVASARLAYTMIRNFTDRGITIPEVLREWENIYINPDEFSEIRNVAQ
ncbi:SIR2 family protein [Paenibacillus polymyxa]|uniref:SIR2 family protein n=1 Tax=Paenibacillus polymyxa TaxID=1406 RepID=UPI0025B6450B|nr:SIR2 family protein [Paenibacillus polymyxa]MDN4083290.1 SIR2 family protein [Paenibacillus polymyxa]MDN4089599.1 SIR2 family protein [Paenibacillus polymyxa]MDN4110257.1 SIR2 family protein [Paenibacillus polymyxa]